jgi:hypothetical protein
MAEIRQEIITMGATTLSRTYNARLTALLDKIRPVIQNQITTANPFYFKYKKSGNWKTVSQLGDRYRVPLMYEFAPIDTFGANGVGQVDVTPTDGQTPAFFDWSRMASSITIGDFERAQNKGAALDLLKSKTEQAMSGLEDRFGRWLVQGHGAVDGSSITTPRTSAVNGSTFIDPIPLLINATGATTTGGQLGTGTVGQINAATETWWKNVAMLGSATAYAGLLKEVDHLINLCSQSAGPGPDLFVTDLRGYEVISAALRAQQRFTDYEEVSFPWKAIRLNGAPLVFDQFIPRVASAGSVSASTTIGSGRESTMYAINSKYIGVTVYSGADFTPGEFVRAPNGAGETAIIQWYGTHWMSRRDKHGVLGGFDNSATS